MRIRESWNVRATSFSTPTAGVRRPAVYRRRVRRMDFADRVARRDEAIRKVWLLKGIYPRNGEGDPFCGEENHWAGTWECFQIRLTGFTGLRCRL